ncbi:Protein of uncharacterised function (DUF969) [Dermatophilus congolensis]|uniref:Protein of uncharacterized function (DUF969) n=1 Tax=Dermatophilus congolensis TaxID=1863 RepID=A0A239VTP1_9MICO|nr:DUF969 domain-containing protein [Dermatophilus congolensis]SNV25621.1 Protein of uncharacterised function (DUF969) [Dermatophilus congolensis]
MWVLVAVVVVVVGFALRVNSMLVVTAAGVVAGVVAGMSPVRIVEAFGSGFAGSRQVTIFVIALPVIGLVERMGLQDQARVLMGRLRGMTVGRLLAVYLAIRQVSAALGLNSIGGPAQAVRPIVAPMAEGAAQRKYGFVNGAMREKIRSFAASADNVGLFFGEDIFLAMGSILLITGFVDSTYGLQLDALEIALWAIPTGLCALVIHGFRMLRFDRQVSALAQSGADSVDSEGGR